MAGTLGRKARGQTLAARALRKGAGMVGSRIAKRFPVAGYDLAEVTRSVTGRGLVSRTAAIVITRLATRSLPGTVLVGGGLLAKALYDRRKDRRARENAEDAGE